MSPLLLIPADIGWAASSRTLMRTPLTMAQIVSLRIVEVLLSATTVVLASLSTKGNSSGSRGVVSQGLKAVLISKSAEYSSPTTSTFTTTCFQYPTQNAACFKSFICTNKIARTSVACSVVGIAVIGAYTNRKRIREDSP